MDIYSKERFEQVMNDLKTVVLPQVKTAIEAREKKTVVAALTQRVAAIEALIGDSSQADSDNIINKVVEFVAFFANITEETTLAGLLSNLSTQISNLGNIATPNKGTCSTAAATAAKEVTLPNSFALEDGAIAIVKFTNGIGVAGSTLSVNAGTAKAINYRGAALGANQVKAGQEVLMRYDGTAWNIVGDLTPSGFVITTDETTGTDIFTAVGSATVSHNDSTGADEFVF